jgi:triacylglycerol lipase
VTHSKIILVVGITMVFVFGCWAQNDAQEGSQTGKKEVPVITFKNMSPPFKDYEYFQGFKKYGFQIDATSFSLVNAWWLAEISTLVYADEEFVKSRFKRAGLPEVRFFEGQSTQCYVANNDKFAIVAFRGSEIWKKRDELDIGEIVADLKADVDIRLVDWPQGGKVHRGFKEALDEVWPDLLPYIRKLAEKGCKIWVTGHSLGGALATLCGELYGNVQGVYTFGSPWVGNEDFKENVSTKVYRIVNDEDIVSRLPSFGVFVYVGEVKFIDGDGIIRDEMDEKEYINEPPQDYSNGRQNADQPKKKPFEGFVPAPFRDHVPVLYAVHLWNNLIESRQ